jgi:hypothetical protein
MKKKGRILGIMTSVATNKYSISSSAGLVVSGKAMRQSDTVAYARAYREETMVFDEGKR